MQGFAVAIDSLRRSGTEMAAAGRGVDGHGQRIAGGTAVWGADPEGAAFGGAYAEVADAAREALTAITAELASIGDRLAAMADSYEETDVSEAHRFQGLR